MKRLLLFMIAIVTLTIDSKAQDDMNSTPLSFEAVEDGTELTIKNKNAISIKVTHSHNAFGNWSENTWYNQDETMTVTLSAGDILSVRLYDANTFEENFNINASKDIYVFGNPLSLVFSGGFSGKTDLSGCPKSVLKELFRIAWPGNPHIKNHPEKDIVLPATTLKESCYQGMFYGTGLTRAPELPATTLAFRCYYFMFAYCRDLTAGPALPATTLTDECYHAMFEGCSSLTDAPALPAMTLTYSCYDNMFRDCTSLTTAPDLLAPKLDQDSYYYMFNGCKQLNYVKCLATDISASGSTGSWLVGVSPTGTFVKADGMNDWTNDYRGIPESWIVKNESEMPSGIDATQVSNNQDPRNHVYDLQGRRVEPSAKGMYIVNGKKVLLP
jgi:hypothetical protein